MRTMGRREFLTGTGLALLGPVVLLKDVLADEPCEMCKSRIAAGGDPCPRCAARHGKGVHGTKTDLFACINRASDPDNMTTLEKKHAPVISIPSYVKINQPFYLTAQVGNIVHGMSPNHWIQWIEVHADNVLVSRTEFTPRSPSAIVTVPLLTQKETMLKVLERCNLHGIWESSQRVVPV